MWRWVTRGLVVFTLFALVAPALLGQTTDVIGTLESPDSSAAQYGVVLVKGWVLAQPQLSKLELYVDDQYQSKVPTILPRIDIIEAYPNWPGIHNTAPGFQTGFLANRFSNGPHTIEVRAYTSDNKVVPLGRRTITIDNTQNQSPFGSLDIPDASGVTNAAGSFPVSGWATDTDGIARVDILIDGGVMQSAMYGDARPDVSNTYPDFPAALFSGFVANVDTTRVQEGVHLLEVRATDRNINPKSRVIGTRQIQVLNNDENLKPFGYLDEPQRDAVLYGTSCGTIPIISPPVNPRSHITPVRGWALDLGHRSDLGRVSYVELLIDGARWFSTDDCGYSAIFGAYVNCYGLPRYDVERFYPNYPDAPRAGFMFTLDVGALFALGVTPGNHVLKVRVGDQAQTVADIPRREGIPVFFSCAGQGFNFPGVGFIDIPTSFDYMKGNATFQGWAVDENGGVKAVEIIVDGNFIGNAEYGFPRPDVVASNPQLFATPNSGWRFTMDTTRLSNARHRLTVRVLDQTGQRSEIGSVDFYVSNPQ